MLSTLYLLPLSRKQANVDELNPIFKNNYFQPEKLISRKNETDFSKSTSYLLVKHLIGVAKFFKESACILKAPVSLTTKF